MLIGFITDIFGLDKDTIKPYLEWLGINVSDPMASKIWFWIITLTVLFYVGRWIIGKGRIFYSRYSAVNKWREQYVKDKLEKDYHDYLEEENYQLFIPTKFQNYPPNDYPDPHDSLIVSSELLIEKFLNEILTRKNTNRDLYCVLGGSGMGKTTFAIHLFKEYVWKYKKENLPFEISFFPLSDDSVIEKINEIENQKDHVLILDALDESSQAAKNFASYIDKLEKAIKDFRIVIITCRTQFFKTEEEELKESKLRNYGISKGFRTYNRQYISPLADKDIVDYIDKKYPFKLLRPSTYKNREKREKAKLIIRSSGNIMVRPLMLSYIESLLGDSNDIVTTNDMYQHLISSWIGREADMISGAEERTKIKDAIWTLSQKLAVNLYKNRRRRNGYYIASVEFEQFKVANDYDSIDYSFDSRSLVNRNSSGDIKFAHKSFLEFFLAKEKWEHPDFNFEFEGMDMSLMFYYEMFQEAVNKDVAAGAIKLIKDEIPGHWNIAGIKAVSFIQEPSFRYELFSKLFAIEHVTLYSGMVNERMLDWLSTTSIKSISIQKELIKDLGALIDISSLEVINLKDCRVCLSPELLSTIASKGITLIMNDKVFCYYPRTYHYVDRAINNVLRKHRKCANFADMVEIPT